eukprot:2690766-Karenia_brevis.AAC.1
MGSEIICTLSVDAKQRLEQSGQRGFVAATQEERPPDEMAFSESPVTESQPVDQQPVDAAGAFPSIPEE